MQAVFLGSIGTIADTSELQRAAFNDAFREHGLDWQWDRDAYREMLGQAGGRARIAEAAKTKGVEVDAEAVHATKTRLFQAALDDGAATLRPGVADLIAHAGEKGLRIGVVTTTSRGNVEHLLAAVGLEQDRFDIIVTREHVEQPKPDPECYAYAAKCLGVDAAACVAVEDNPDGVRAARAAGVNCYAWPNENTAGQDFGDATMAGRDIDQAVFGAAA
ncbi:HAD family phosphatase [uncultured Jannaschia sp.]|uniref:HAD family hydrolase n=1 Tax=uncultured Jannaschia sp. TaxID=293347 RepID=UPI00260FA4B0|nr:HAD-IA family hydrolase [uncultured Jannaschia sp.]